MSSPRYPETFKIEAVKQVTERGLPVAEVAKALGVSNLASMSGSSSMVSLLSSNTKSLSCKPRYAA